MKTGSDIRNIYKECLNETGVPQFYKCMDLVGAMKFYNYESVKETIHADKDTQW